MKKLLAALALTIAGMSSAFAQSTTDCTVHSYDEFFEKRESCARPLLGLDGNPLPDTYNRYVWAFEDSDGNLTLTQPAGEEYPMVFGVWADNDGNLVKGTGYSYEPTAESPWELVPRDSWSCPSGTGPGDYAGTCLPLISAGTIESGGDRITYCEAGLTSQYCNDPGDAIPTSGPVAAAIASDPSLATGWTSGSSNRVNYKGAAQGSLTETALKTTGADMLDLKAALFIIIAVILGIVVLVSHGKKLRNLFHGIDTNSQEYKDGFAKGQTARTRQAGYRDGKKSRK